ncbi:MAG: hypothetical protein EPN85_12650 [Bacteroidetes bacterium]|nr:MAG: hypothetical protein EPN85_12650 [Bacteroidota bacterium]
MIASEDLFELIKSLSQTEKRYFKRHCSLNMRRGKNNCLAVFDAVESQREYDEDKLKNKFRHEKFITQFPVLKNYLYEQILKSLRSYHRSIHSEVKDLIRNAEILYEKGLYNRAKKYVLKAKEIARDHEMQWALLEISRIWEIKMAKKKHDMHWLKKIMEESGNEFELLKNTELYKNIELNMFVLYNIHGKERKKGYLAKMQKIIESKPMQNDKTALTFDSKLRFYNTYVLFMHGKGDTGQMDTYAKKIIALYQAHPHKIQTDLASYVAYLHNLFIATINEKKYSEAAAHLETMKREFLLSKNRSQKINHFYYYYSPLLVYYNLTGQFASAIQCIVSFKKQLEESESAMNMLEKTVLFANISVSYFGSGQYKNCIHWLNRLRDEVSLTIRPDFESFLRLFYIIVHYEVGNMDLLIPLIQSFYRYLKKKEQLYKFETVIIHFFRNELPETDNQKERIQAFQKLRNKLLPLAKDEYEKNVFEYFDYISWLESKIENKSFAEVVREKAKQYA